MTSQAQRRIVLATNNAGKVKEFQDLIPSFLQQQIIPQSVFNIPEVDETGLTFVENAIIKARHAALHTKLPAIGDDSGLIVDALDGQPGIYSARYAGKNAPQAAHTAKLLAALKNIPSEKRTARFYCTLVYLQYSDDPIPIIAEGVWEGSILLTERGEHGFGYDPIFYVPTHNCSAAELSLEQKATLSHRGQACRQLLTLLKKHAIFNA